MKFYPSIQNETACAGEIVQRLRALTALPEEPGSRWIPASLPGGSQLPGTLENLMPSSGLCGHLNICGAYKLTQGTHTHTHTHIYKNFEKLK